jgi:transcriptional regulator with XRE-family HTH domain
MSLTHEDVRLGRLLRAIRQRAAQTQQDLAAQARVPVADLRLVEHGRVGEVRLERTRRLFSAAGGRVKLTAWWNGAAADRLLDERHAGLVEKLVMLVARRGWLTPVEVTFSEYGERGSIDVLAGHPTCRAVGVFEVKSDIGSLEETNRVLDVKERLAPRIALAQFGWRPTTVGRILVLPEDATVRRLIARHGQTMRAIYPAGSREVRAWLRKPNRPIRAIWFLSETPNRRTENG